MATPSKHKAHVLCLENVLPYICDMLKIIAITFLIVFEILFSRHFEIQYYKKYSSNITEKYFYIMIKRYSLKLKSLA